MDRDSEILYLMGPWKFPCILWHGQRFRNSLPNGSREISMYPVTLRLIQKFCTERVHGSFLVSCNIETNSKMFLPIKWSMEISTYPVTLILRLYQKFFTERVHENFHVSCNIETNIIQKCFTERVHGKSMYPLTLRLIQKCFYLKGPWKFPCSL